MAQDLSSIILAHKKQSALGTRATGTGASGLEVLASQGFQQQIAQIASGLLSRSRMAAKGRAGSEFYNFAGETELQVGNIAGIMDAVLGGTTSAAVTLDNTTLTSCAISGTGTTITFTGGNAITAGLRVGMTARLTGMTVPGNNGKYFPILGISANGRVLTVPSGILTDEAADTSFSLVISPAVFTPSTYVKSEHTIEAYLADIDRSLVGTDFRWNGLSFSMEPDNPVTVSVSAGGSDLEMLDTASSPNFTNPTFVEGESLVMLDGAVYFGTTKRVNLASFNFGLTAPVSGLPLMSRKKSIDAFLGQFALEGQFTGVIEDGADFDAFRREDQVSIYLHCAELNALNPWAARYVGIYIPNMSFGGWSVPAGGEGAAIQTVPMNGGRDKRGVALGFAPTSLLISTSN
ncbi:phage tail tube protein [Gemmatimonas sp.]|uniref:phage tail tube protein n=1 Tax=Gemmatimonas sp. TaxID=1962908 RepID=UPI00334111B7